MRVDQPGAYRLKVRIRSSELYRVLVLDRVLQVRQVADPTARDALSALIDNGETLRDRIPEQYSNREARIQSVAFVTESRAAINDLDNRRFSRGLTTQSLTTPDRRVEMITSGRLSSQRFGSYTTFEVKSELKNPVPGPLPLLSADRLSLKVQGG
jgi:hypothetical protein